MTPLGVQITKRIKPSREHTAIQAGKLLLHNCVPLMVNSNIGRLVLSAAAFPGYFTRCLSFTKINFNLSNALWKHQINFNLSMNFRSVSDTVVSIAPILQSVNHMLYSSTETLLCHAA